MNVESIKPWQWCLAGLGVGLVLLLVRHIQPEPQVRSMGQEQFEQKLVQEAFAGNPMLTDLVVRPSAAGHRVTGRELVLTPAEWIAVPFVFDAPRPYTPTDPSVQLAGQSPTVLDFLEAVRQQFPEVSYSYAWWEGPTMQVLLYVGGALLLVGGIWPLALGLMVDAGLGRKKPGSEAETEETAPAASPIDPEQLDKTIKTLEAGIGAGTGDRPVPGQQPAIPAVAKLGQQPLEAAPHRQANENKEYHGKFYPTEVHKEDEAQDVAAKPR